MGYSSGGNVNNSFWDVNFSGRTTSAGGTGKTTAQMQDINTFLNAGWDFTGETLNGMQNIWTMIQYPQLNWQVRGFAIVPNVISMSQADAENAIIASGLTVGTIGSAYSDIIPAGTIVSQSPLAGIIVPCDSPLNIVVNLGKLYSGGDGTETNPYKIANVSDWNDLMKIPLNWDKYFILIADINLQNVSLTPVGNPTTYFTGIFDGQNHTIFKFDLYYPSDNDNCIGLFGNSDGKILNLAVEDVNVTGKGGKNGGLVGFNKGTIINCHSTGFVRGSVAFHYLYVGGLVGYNSGNIISNFSTCTVSGSSSNCIGGLVGDNAHGNISNCYSSGKVTGNGGLVGGNSGNISSCYSISDVNGSSTGTFAGGLVGVNVVGGNITNCYSTGSVISNYADTGGLVGGNDDGNITNCYSTGLVKCNRMPFGGLAGATSKGGIANSFWDVNTSCQATSDGGIGKTTAEMKTLSTFTSAGWDFVGETANGTEDIWTICEGINYPKFVWQNQPPIAEAGEDQTVYAWIDGIAGITLDGSDSNDPDGDSLTYKWTWIIDSNIYEANGVNPTIELPVGVHTIQLIVNDGLVDSAVDDVNITVIAPLKSALGITPCIINRSSRPSYILAFVRMPDGIMKKDISNEPLTLYPGEIEASRQWIVSIPCGFGRHKKWLTEIFAFFNKDDVLDAIPTNGRVELKVAGELVSGRCFYGCDTVKITGPRWPFHWPKK